LIGQDYAICGFFANFVVAPRKIPFARAGLTSKNLLSISPLTLGPFVRRGFDRAQAGPAKLLLQCDRIKKGRTPRY